MIKYLENNTRSIEVSLDSDDLSRIHKQYNSSGNPYNLEDLNGFVKQDLVNMFTFDYLIQACSEMDSDIKDVYPSITGNTFYLANNSIDLSLTPSNIFAFKEGICVWNNSGLRFIYGNTTNAYDVRYFDYSGYIQNDKSI